MDTYRYPITPLPILVFLKQCLIKPAYSYSLVLFLIVDYTIIHISPKYITPYWMWNPQQIISLNKLFLIFLLNIPPQHMGLTLVLNIIL